MKASELLTKSSSELENLLISLREEQFKIRMQKSTAQLKTNHQFKVLRKDIARIKTVLGGMGAKS
ncbi:MAG: 50S ribosomal protein L29 [Candidatus Berkiella sp.]